MEEKPEEIVGLLMLSSQRIALETEPVDFDLEAFFVGNNSSARMADLLSDYLPSACGRAFLRERGILVSDFYQRYLDDESLGPEQRYDQNPLWNIVEKFTETIRMNSETRIQFSCLAQQSAEVDCVNKALNSGQSFEDLKGSKFGNGIFLSSLYAD